MINVASQSGLPGPVGSTWERFCEAGYQDEALPDERGWMRADVTSGFVVGRIAVRDFLGEEVARKIGRARPYTRQQKCNLMKEGKVLERCQWPVMGVPFLPELQITLIAGELVASKRRRNRKIFTDPSSGSGLSFNGERAFTSAEPE